MAMPISDPVVIVAVWLTDRYLYVKDATGQKYVLSRDDWKFPYLGSIARKDLQTLVRIDSKPLWEGCHELLGIHRVAQEGAA